MSNFLHNLVRRGAGLPVTSIQAPAPSPFAPEVHMPELGAIEAEPEATAESQSVARTVREALPHPAVQRFVARPEPPPTSPPRPAQPAPPVAGGSFHDTPSPLPTPALPSVPGREPPARPASVAQPATPPLPAPHAGQDLPAPAALPGVQVDQETAQGALGLPPVLFVQSAPAAASPVSGLVSVVTEGRDRTAAAEEQLPATPAIQPALAELSASLRFPSVAPAPSPSPPTPRPIHVRIGRVEVRGAPPPIAPSAPAPLGFAAYARVRNYRNWSP